MENLIGKVGICSIGEIGLITDYVELPWGMSYVGIKVYDGGAWASRNPLIIANSIEEYMQLRDNPERDLIVWKYNLLRNASRMKTGLDQSMVTVNWGD